MPVREDARAYELVLPEVERILRRPDDYEPLWRDGWNFIARSLESFARGASGIEEDTDAGFSLITLAPTYTLLKASRPRATPLPSPPSAITRAANSFSSPRRSPAPAGLIA